MMTSAAAESTEPASSGSRDDAVEGPDCVGRSPPTDKIEGINVEFHGSSFLVTSS